MQIYRALETEADELSSLAIVAKRYWGYSDDQINVWRPSLDISAKTISAQPTFVGNLDGQTVGFYSLVSLHPAWELDHLWVLPSFIKRGFGRALLAHAIQTAANAGASAINIDADPYAEAFYLACGAKRIGMVAAPIAEQPNRARPQLVLAIARSNMAFERDAPKAARPSTLR